MNLLALQKTINDNFMNINSMHYSNGKIYIGLSWDLTLRQFKNFANEIKLCKPKDLQLNFSNYTIVIEN